MSWTKTQNRSIWWLLVPWRPRPALIEASSDFPFLITRWSQDITGGWGFFKAQNQAPFALIRSHSASQNEPMVHCCIQKRCLMVFSKMVNGRSACECRPWSPVAWVSNGKRTCRSYWIARGKTLHLFWSGFIEDRGNGRSQSQFAASFCVTETRCHGHYT